MSDDSIPRWFWVFLAVFLIIVGLYLLGATIILHD